MGTLSVEANNNEMGSTFRSKTGDMDTAGSAPWYRLVGTLVLGCLLALLRLLRSGSSSAWKANKKRSKRAKEFPGVKPATAPIASHASVHAQSLNY